MQTVLAKIVADKAIWVEARKQQQPLASFQNEIQPSTRHFYDALRARVPPLFCESIAIKGVIRDDFDPARIASIYQHYASAISVLTDEKYFQGASIFCRSLAKAHRSRFCVRILLSILSDLPCPLLSGRCLFTDALGSG